MAHVKQTNSNLWVPQSTHEKIDSQKMFIENVEQHERNYTDLVGRIHAQVESIAQLKVLDVSSSTTTIKAGTVVMVNGVGLFYYNPASTEAEDNEEIIKPTTGSGRWILSGGGGNLIVDDTDYGEDTDSDKSGVTLKIKKLFNKKIKTNFFPITTTKAVRDTSTGKSLFQLLGIIPMMEDGGEAGGADVRDADTLGGVVSSEYAKKSDYNGIICVLLNDNWVRQSDGSYIYTVAHQGLTGNEIFDVSIYDDGTATSAQFDAFNELITRIDTNVGEIVIKASAKPSVTFSIVLRGMCVIDEIVVVNLSEVLTKYDAIESRISALEKKLL